MSLFLFLVGFVAGALALAHVLRSVLARALPPKSSRIASFQTPGISATERLPSISAISIRTRNMICRSYVSSSACTRIGPGSTRFTAAIHSSIVTSDSCSGKQSRSFPKCRSQICLLRLTL
jgi:hypothetical protein